MIGDCYRQAGREITDHTSREDLTLCHGYPILRGGEHVGERFGHAWLEYQDETGVWYVVDPSTGGIRVQRVLWYALGHIDPKHVHRYTRREAVWEMVETEVWGPWVDDPEEYEVRYTND